MHGVCKALAFGRLSPFLHRVAGCGEHFEGCVELGVVEDLEVLALGVKLDAAEKFVGVFLEAVVDELVFLLGGEILVACFSRGLRFLVAAELQEELALGFAFEEVQDAALLLAQLEAQANTLQGSFTKVQNAWENLLESMGSAAEKSGLTKALSNWAAGVQIIADKLGGGGAPAKSVNREELIGSTPEIQAQADQLAIDRKRIEELKAVKIADSKEGFARLDEMTPINPNRKGIQERLEMNAGIIDILNKALDDLDAKQKALNIQTVTPAEAEANRARLAQADSPGQKTTDELSQKAADAYDKEQARKDADQRKVDAISRANADAYDKEQARLQKEQFAFSRPIADRLSQIGGYNAGRGPASTDRMLDSIEKSTQRTAAAVEKIANKPDRPLPVTSSF